MQFSWQYITCLSLLGMQRRVNDCQIYYIAIKGYKQLSIFMHLQSNKIKRYKISNTQNQIQILKPFYLKSKTTFDNMERSQYRQVQQISRFLSNYSVSNLNKKQYQPEDAMIISSESQSSNNYLVKHIPIDQEECDLQNIIETLSQHRDFDSKYILTLLDFQIIQNGQNSQGNRFIRTIYQYGKKSLEEQIQIRKNTQLYFQQDELWVLLSSLVNPLAYLQSKRVIYGVLGSNKIFVDPKIKLLDPSCTGIDPYQISIQRHYSPQLLNHNHQDQNENANQQMSQNNQKVDMFKSDIFVLGLIILQSGLLLNFTNLPENTKFDLSDIQEYVNEFQEMYSQNLSEMVKRMLNFIPEHRPSFQQILAQINKMFQFSSCQIEIVSPLQKDKQDQPNQMQLLQEGLEQQNKDVLDDCYKQAQQMTQFQKAKLKFLGDSNYSHSRNKSISQNQSAIDLNFNEVNQNSGDKCGYTRQQQGHNSTNDKRKYKAKQIKDKLVKNFTSHPGQIVAEYPQIESSYRNEIPFQCFQTQRKTNINNKTLQKRAKSRSKTVMSCQHDENSSFQNSSFQQNRLRNLNYQDQNKSLFTDPELMKLIKSDLKKIQQKRTGVIMNGKVIYENKENIHKNNSNLEYASNGNSTKNINTNTNYVKFGNLNHNNHKNDQFKKQVEGKNNRNSLTYQTKAESGISIQSRFEYNTLKENNKSSGLHYHYRHETRL